MPRNEREALKDTVLPVGRGGKDDLYPVLVTKGTVVSYDLYTMHRRTNCYERPERWENDKLQPCWGYLPFDGGPRICAGQRYALTEAGYVVVRLVQDFRVLAKQDAGSRQKLMTLTLSSAMGRRCALLPHKRLIEAVIVVLKSFFFEYATISLYYFVLIRTTKL